MRLASYYERGLRIGHVADGWVWDLRRAYELFLLEVQHEPSAAALSIAHVPPDMAEFIALNSARLGLLESALNRLIERPERHGWLRDQCVLLQLQGLRLLAPVIRPSKIVNVGNAYPEHIRNSAIAKGLDPDTVPIPSEVKVSFFKTSSAVTAPGDPVRYPGDSGKWDFEGELGIVIGSPCTQVSAADANEYVFGYTIFNDASIRDVPVVQGGTVSPTAKSADTTAPLGPWIVTSDSLKHDPNDLQIRTFVNDDLRQDARTSSMMWTVQEIVSKTSQRISLLPGDVIATSSPPGVGSETGQFLAEGDVVRIEIEGIGVLSNPVGAPR